MSFSNLLKYFLKTFRQFLSRYIQEACQRGMNIPTPADCQIVRNDPSVLQEKLEQAALNDCEFVLFVHPNNADEMHGLFL